MREHGRRALQGGGARLTAYRSRATGQPSRNLHAITGGIVGFAAHCDHRDLRPRVFLVPNGRDRTMIGKFSLWHAGPEPVEP